MQSGWAKAGALVGAALLGGVVAVGLGQTFDSGSTTTDIREIQRLDQVACADRLAGRRDQVDDAHARRIGECSEERRARLCLLVGEGWSAERGAAVDNG